MKKYDARRCLDIAGSLVGIAATALVIPAVALALKVESYKMGSPDTDIFYKQKRLGKNRQKFHMHKFRTMARDPLQNEKKVTTAVGRFLRRTSIDEMPQFFNVLAGDMSIVGPRPLLRPLPPTYQPRYKVRPGMTGPAAVAGYRGMLPPAGMFKECDGGLKLDNKYAKRGTVSDYFIIIAKTIPIVIIGKNTNGEWKIERDAKLARERTKLKPTASPEEPNKA